MDGIFVDESELSIEQLTDPDFAFKEIEKLNGKKLGKFRRLIPVFSKAGIQPPII